MTDTTTSRNDPVFGLPTPLLFAHRGGALEAPENTLAAFRHARTAGADVLELDVHSIPVEPGSDERTLVVWHGPSLDNVRLKSRAIERLGGAPSIEDAAWSDLDGAQVAPPGWPATHLDRLPENHEARIIRLQELLDDPELGHCPLNIEMKEATFRATEPASRTNVRQLLNMFREDWGRNERQIALASRSRTLLDLADELRQPGDRFARSFSIRGALEVIFGGRKLGRNRALQVPWWPFAAGPRLIRRAHRNGCAIHVFITKPVGLDGGPGEPDREVLFRLLDRGVDGVMTDRPSRVARLIGLWRDLRAGGHHE